MFDFKCEKCGEWEHFEFSPRQTICNKCCLKSVRNEKTPSRGVIPKYEHEETELDIAIKVMRGIAEIAQLENNWNSYGASEFSKEEVASALLECARMLENGEKPEVKPTVNGKIEISTKSV